MTSDVNPSLNGSHASEARSEHRLPVSPDLLSFASDTKPMANGVPTFAKPFGALGALTIDVTHEMNNLMMVAFGNLELLEKQALSDKAIRQLARIRWSMHRATRLAEQMLSFSRLDATQSQVFDLNTVICNFDRMLEQAAGQGISVVLELARRPVMMRVDRQQLKLALLNLIGNAREAIRGQGTIVVRTAAPHVDGLDDALAVEVSVSGLGPEKPPEAPQTTRTVFFTDDVPGRDTGIDLWMVQRFARDAGGKVTIESNVGEGTTVHLSLPKA